jgi:tetratricopeptide (TPR) repeat protein
MTWIVAAVAAALAAVAVVGVLRPFSRRGEPALERLADPLEDERLSLLRALRDLEDERASGALSEDDYRSLKGETEARAVAVLRALEARDGSGELAAGLKEMRSAATAGFAGPSGNGQRASPEVRARRLPTFVIAGLALAAVIALLAGSLSARPPGGSATGDDVGGGGRSSDPLSFFEQRVEDHPRDVAARLDLARRYLDAGDVRAGIAQYLVALQLDPRNVEAQANLGFLLFRAGKAREGLRAVDAALEVDPAYPEALYFKGLILLQGLRKLDQAAEAFRAYLAAAPFGSRRSEVEGLLRQAESGSKEPED